MLLTLALQLWPGASEALRFVRTSDAQGARWQLLTAQWVHLSGWHAAANALTFGLIVAASRAWVRWPMPLVALGGGYAGVALVVALDTNCRYYAGASGALHGLLAGNAAGMLWAIRGPERPAGHAAEAARVLALRRRRLLAAAVLGAVALKLWLQAAGVPDVPGGEWDFPVYHPAHVAGALGGIALVSLLCAVRAARAAQAQAQRGQ